MYKSRYSPSCSFSEMLAALCIWTLPRRFVVTLTTFICENLYIIWWPFMTNLGLIDPFFLPVKVVLSISYLVPEII